MADIKVGDHLWAVEQRGRYNHGSYVVVTKIGRKWTYVADAEKPSWDRGRIDEDMAFDGNGFTSPGRCYLSREDYERNQRITSAWDALRSFVRDTWRCPTHLSETDLADILARLNELPHQDRRV